MAEVLTEELNFGQYSYGTGVDGLQKRKWLWNNGGSNSLVAPTLSWDSGTNEAGRNPTFTISSLLVGDIAQLQVDDDAAFAAPIYGDQSIGPLDAFQAASGTLNFDTIPTLAYATQYWAHARYQRGGIWSPWSNVPTKTMDAAAVFSALPSYSSTHAATSAGARVFSNVPLGTADLSRKLVAQVGGYFGGGVPVLRVYNSVGSGSFTDYNVVPDASYTVAPASNQNWAFEIPFAVGTATDITIIGTSSDCTLDLWSVIGAVNSSKTSMAMASASDGARLVTPTTPINGKTIVFGAVFAAAGTPAWSNATANVGDSGSAFSRAIAYRTAAGSPVATQVGLTGYAGFTTTSLLALSYGP